MRSRVQVVALSAEAAGFSQEIRDFFRELDRAGESTLAGECTPAVDVYENGDALEVAVDLPDVDPAAIRIVFKGDTLLVVGLKAPRRGHGNATFHLVERGYGRFARAVRLSLACDTRRARATLIGGELRINVPKIAERRGEPVRVPIAGHTH
jgi:HSP20 family protein